MPFLQSALAVVALVGAYALIVSERVERPIAALLGGAVLIVAGVLSQREAIAFIDFNTIGLLAGMMLIVNVARKSGVFSFLAIRAAQLVRASPAGVLAMFAAITALLSAFVNNVTVVLLVVPVTFVVCDELGVIAYPFLFAEILASNIGGTATLIGDPPNILIGSATGLSFDAFAWHLAPLSIVVLLFQIAAIHVLWGRKMKAEPERRRRVMDIRATKAIEDRYLLACSAVVIPAVLAGLIAADTLRLQPATVALSGAGVLLLLQSLPQSRTIRGEHLNRAIAEVEWTMLIFLVGLFVMIGAIQKTGILGAIGRILLASSAHTPALAAGIVLWFSALLSSIVDNVPYVAAMIPVVKGIAPALGGGKAAAPVWWALAIGAGLGGNGTLIGASANIAVASLAERGGLRFRFIEFAVRAFPFMLASIAVAQVYILWRYF
ncbi:MAG TPA: ArsB/NhaD family transporter [Rhizomicrobium sp.]|jgi:Na+/H+ antiporter NhaD/arsenite permease-like protein|nr:ArsB/NhaD family transporter [Rhizomicrobium sp.]